MIILQPFQNIFVDGLIIDPVGIPEKHQSFQSFPGGLDTYIVQQFINIQISVRKRGLLDVPLPYLCAPGEICPQLPVSHHLVIGIIRGIRKHVLIFILKILHEHALAVENPGIFLLNSPVVKFCVAEIQAAALPCDVPHPVEDLPHLVPLLGRLLDFGGLQDEPAHSRHGTGIVLDFIIGRFLADSLSWRLC